MNHRGLRSNSNWRYRTIKKYKHRAQKFLERSQTLQESLAWQKVIDWFNTILKEQREITPFGAIGLTEDEEK